MVIIKKVLTKSGLGARLKLRGYFMNIHKLIEVVNYMLKKYEYRLNYTKLLKMLYLADRQSYYDIGSPITGDTYAALKAGPILSNTYNLIRNKGNQNDQNLWNSRFLKDAYDLVALTDKIPCNTLSDYEKEVLDGIDSKFHNYTFTDLIEYTHANCPEWKAPKDSALPISIESILQALGKSPDEIAFIIEEEQSFAQEEAALAQLSELNA